MIDQVLEASRQLLPFRDVLHLRDDVERLATARRGRSTRSPAPRRNGPRRGGSASRPGSWGSGRRGARRRDSASRSTSSGCVIARSVVAFSSSRVWPVIRQSASLTCSQRPSMSMSAMPIGALSNALSKRSRTSCRPRSAARRAAASRLPSATRRRSSSFASASSFSALWCAPSRRSSACTVVRERRVFGGAPGSSRERLEPIHRPHRLSGGIMPEMRPGSPPVDLPTTRITPFIVSRPTRRSWAVALPGTSLPRGARSGGCGASSRRS